MLSSFVRANLIYPLCERHEGRSIRSKLAQLRSAMAEPYSRRLVRRQERIAAVVQRAAVDVPYYRDLFHAIGFDPIRLTFDSKWLQDIPFLTKDIVREQGWRMLSERVSPGRRHERKTGGSTGPAAMFYYSDSALDWSAAAHLLSYEWTGKFRRDREIHLSSRFPETFPLRDRLKEWVKCQAMNRVNVSTHSFDDDGLAEAWADIRRVRPALLQGHPSTMAALARFVEKKFGSAHGVVARIQSTGELMTASHRAVMERALGSAVYNSYGNAELGVIAQQIVPSAEAGLKVIDAIAWAEEDCGEIIVTNLTNDLMPLLRYRTGDLARVQDGADGRYIHDLVGRIHDVVRIGDKTYPTHYLQDLLDRLGGVEDFQVVQRDGSSLTFRLVVPDLNRRDGLRERLHQWWGDGATVEFINPQDLIRAGARGKFRYLAECV